MNAYDLAYLFWNGKIQTNEITVVTPYVWRQVCATAAIKPDQTWNQIYL